MSKVRVLIADDHAVVREGLKQLLVGEFKDVSVGDAENARELLSQLQEQEWSMVLLDIGMPGKSGIEMLRDVKKLRPNLPVLIVSIYPEEQYAARALKAGASGYIPKDSSRQEMIGAFRKALSGGKYVSSSLAETLAFNMAADTDRLPHEMLSNREHEVMRGLVLGKPIKQIAGELELSAKTISAFRSRVLAKMRMQSNAELARYAAEHELVKAEAG